MAPLPTEDRPTYERPAGEHWFTTDDETRLFYRHWPGASPRAIVLLHRGHEHSGRLAHIVEELDLPDFHFFAWDARGHGRSPGDRGDSPSIGRLVRDLDNFVHHIAATLSIPLSEIAVIAQSVASVITTAWVHSYAPPIRAMVLAAPAFSVKLYVPFAKPSLAARYAAFGNFFVQSYVKARFLTHDPDRIASYESDPLITRAISVRVLLGLYEAGDRVVADAATIHTPTLLLQSGRDWVVRNGPQNLFFDRLGSAIKERHLFPEFFHDTLGEKDRFLALTKVHDFLLARFAAPPAPPRLLDADRDSHTQREYEALRQPKPLRFAETRLGMKTGGRLSDGIRLGLRTGFDSGATLDYIYRNRPAGLTPLGRLIDHGYLNAIGWRGIRIRKQHLERLLAEAARRLAAAGQPVRILDVAAGHGRYILDALPPASTALLRDFDPANVAAIAAEAAARGLSSRVETRAADAFDPAGYPPGSATLGVVSGLWELFPENRPIRASLAGLARALPPGGYLVYTGQPWHPQLEMIARTLPSHRDGAPWIMRRRSQAELDQLVAAAGFAKVDQLVDDWGIFTVSLARRLE